MDQWRACRSIFALTVTVHKILTLYDDECFIIPAGTTVSIGNRNFDKNDPSTHNNILVVLAEDMIVCALDDTKVEQLVETIEVGHD